MGFPAKSLPGIPSCTKSVTIRWGAEAVIKLRQDRDVILNGDEPSALPLWMDGIVIRHASSNFVSVELPNGLEIWWDGLSRVYVDAPPTFFGHTKVFPAIDDDGQLQELRPRPSVSIRDSAGRSMRTSGTI